MIILYFFGHSIFEVRPDQPGNSNILQCDAKPPSRAGGFDLAVEKTNGLEVRSK